MSNISNYAADGLDAILVEIMSMNHAPDVKLVFNRISLSGLESLCKNASQARFPNRRMICWHRRCLAASHKIIPSDSGRNRIIGNDFQDAIGVDLRSEISTAACFRAAYVSKMQLQTVEPIREYITHSYPINKQPAS